MPYIKKEDRIKYEHAVSVIAAILSRLDNYKLGGELNFVIFSIVKKYFDLTEMKYMKLNAIMGALECTKQEIYRRLASELEDRKIEENGDIE